MEKKQQLELMAERLKRAFSCFTYEIKIETNLEFGRIGMHFSSDTQQITSAAIERFSRVVGEVGIFVWEDHIELYGYPLLVP